MRGEREEREERGGGEGGARRRRVQLSARARAYTLIGEDGIDARACVTPAGGCMSSQDDVEEKKRNPEESGLQNVTLPPPRYKKDKKSIRKSIGYFVFVNVRMEASYGCGGKAVDGGGGGGRGGIDLG